MWHHRHKARGKVAPALGERTRVMLGREGLPGRAGARRSSLQAHEQHVQRKRERSLSAPMPRSPSSDSGADVSQSERARVVWWGRAINSHWRRGVGGRAPACPPVAMEPADSTALVAQPPRGSAATAAPSATATAEHCGLGSVAEAMSVDGAVASASLVSGATLQARALDERGAASAALLPAAGGAAPAPPDSEVASDRLPSLPGSERGAPAAALGQTGFHFSPVGMSPSAKRRRQRRI